MDYRDQAVVLSGENGYLARGRFGFIEEKVFVSACDAIEYALRCGDGAVELGAGDFVLDAPVEVTGQASICGMDRRTRLIVRGESGFVFRRSHGSVLRDVALVAGSAEAQNGVVLDACGDSKVINAHISGFSRYGVWMRDKSFLCELRGLSVSGVGGSAIFLENCAEGEFGDYIPTLVSNCIIYGGGKGIELSRAIVVNIVGCVVYQSGDDAYYFRDDSNSVVMSGCRTFQITGNAVVVEKSHELNITGNIFCWHTQCGIIVRDCCWGTITGNNVIDTGSYNNAAHNYTARLSDFSDAPVFDAIQLLNSRGFVVTGNAIFNWGVAPRIKRGVYEDDKCAINEIAHNNTNYYEEADVVSAGLGTHAEGNNRFRDTAYLANTGIMQTFNPEYTRDFIKRVSGEKSNETLGGNAQPYTRVDVESCGEWAGVHNEMEGYQRGFRLPMRNKVEERIT